MEKLEEEKLSSERVPGELGWTSWVSKSGEERCKAGDLSKIWVLQDHRGCSVGKKWGTAGLETLQDQVRARAWAAGGRKRTVRKEEFEHCSRWKGKMGTGEGPGLWHACGQGFGEA